MYNPNCRSCLFGGKCAPTMECDFYFPLDDDMSDAILEQYIKSERQSFESDWWRYIESYQ